VLKLYKFQIFLFTPSRRLSVTPLLMSPESGQWGDVVGSLLGLELEGHVVLLPPSLVLLVLP
jgi:hypothetical protein